MQINMALNNAQDALEMQELGSCSLTLTPSYLGPKPFKELKKIVHPLLLCLIRKVKPFQNDKIC